MPWATVFANVFLPLKLAGVDRAAAAPRIEETLARVGLGRFRAGLSARAFRRHADAGVDRARAGHRAAHAADGRAVRRARRDHALQAQRRSARAVARASHDGGVRHAFGVRVGLSLAARRGDDARGPAGCPANSRSTRRTATPAFPHLGGVRGLLPAWRRKRWATPCERARERQRERACAARAQRAMLRIRAAGRACSRSASLAWDLVVRINGIPPYILPSPGLVLTTLVSRLGDSVGRRCSPRWRPRSRGLRWR